MRSPIPATLGLLVSLPIAALANDGVDRYQKAYPAQFVLFPEPAPAALDAAGYRVLPADSPGGADGERAFRWGQPHAVAAVRLAAWETARTLGPAREPMAIFDVTAENGDTPIEWAKGKPNGRGRHPGGSHDGGLNLDVGYHLTSLKGALETPDFAACTEHYTAAPKPEEAEQCRGPADRLDAERQAYFYLALFRLNREAFEGDLLEEVGIDLFVREAVLRVVRGWVQQKAFGATAELAADMERTFISDKWEGWARSHHHHTHLRFCDMPVYGRARKAVEELLDRERELDAKLAAPAPVVLRARLVSSGLERAIELELLGPGAEVAAARYRLPKGEWTPADPSARYFRAVLDLQGGPRAEEATVEVEAEVTLKGGEVRTLKSPVVLPRLDPRLYVAVRPERFEARALRRGGGLALDLRFPDPYKAYVTKVSYAIWSGTRTEPLVVEGRGPVYGAQVKEEKGAPIKLVLARVLLSGRKEIVLPVVSEPY